MKHYCSFSSSRLGALAFGLFALAGSAAAEPISLDDLPHIHGIAPHPTRPGTIYLATHEGLFLASEDRTAVRISESRDDLMSLAAHPTDAAVLYASGHPPGGGNLGLVRSKDGGRSWQQLSPVAKRPVDFHALTVSPADPNVLYGYSGTLYASADGGQTWAERPRIPGNMFGLAASARDPSVLYAATRTGLLLSVDGGRRWQTLSDKPNPATAAHVSQDGTVRAYVLGMGLIESRDASAEWKPVYNQFGEQVLLQLALEPGDAQRMYALNQFGRLLTSRDAGASWHAFGGDRGPSTPDGLRGEKLYQTHCQQCHGLRGVGENHTDQTLNNRRYIRAPALDDSTHAWHHTDDDLVKTILEGSSREPRMQAFKGVLGESDARDIVTYMKKGVLGESDARDIVTYMKSLWGRRALACQGPKHMDRECLANN
jgi:mono/diheme cytochrome c family protein